MRDFARYRFLVAAACLISCTGRPCATTPSAGDGSNGSGTGTGTAPNEVIAPSEDAAPQQAQPDSQPAQDDPTAPSPDAQPQPDAVSACLSYSDPVPRGRLPEEVNEASGLVVLDGEETVFWLNNDSGDLARIYAVDIDGNLLSTVLMDHIVAIDWEDLSAGPCEPGGDRHGCLYVGDTGDNYRMRPVVLIHRLPVPDAHAGEVRLTSGVETMVLRYPDGAHDAEALVVDDEGRIYLLTKEHDGTFELYSASFQPSVGPVELEYHGAFDISGMPSGDDAVVTGADYDSSNRRLLVRTYNAAVEYRLPPGRRLAELGDTEPERVPVRDEPQGESIAYGEGGFWHVSEGDRPPLYWAACRSD